jgi:DNA polymerase-3 subunit alpha
MPDFDIDLCYRRRQEVIDYVTAKYGAEHVAQIITFGTMAARAAIRDAGRAMGLPYGKVDSAAKLIPFGAGIEASLRQQKELREMYERDGEIASLLSTAMKIEGMPRHGSTHAAGMVITREPVTNFVPVQRGDTEIAAGGSPVTQYAMGNLEELGLLKMDFLGLRYLTVVHETAQAVGLDPEHFPENDAEVFAMLSRGETSGVFQFESSGVTNLLMQQRPNCFEDLIVATSLYRTGPIRAGSIPRYLESRHNPEKLTFKHPLLKNILGETHGSVVYQEQVMQICRELAGYSYGRADLVRRAMSKKKADVMQKEREAFIAGARERGVPESTAGEIFEELSGFAAYAFNKSHAAAYAYLAYQTAYLRHYYFKEYMARLISSEFRLEHISECERKGVKILPPDVNKSLLEFSCEGDNIRFGLLAIKNIGAGFIRAIIKERSSSGGAADNPYTSLYDFCKRLLGSDLNKRAVEALIRSGAFDGFGHNRRSMSMAYEEILDGLSQNRGIEGQLDLFGLSGESEAVEIFKMPEVSEFESMQLLQMEKESLGIYVSGHPIDKFGAYIRLHGFKQIGAVINNAKDNDGVSVIAMLVSKKQFITKAGKAMCFTELEDKTGKIEAIIFSDLYEKEAGNLHVGAIYSLSGSISTKEEEDAKIIIKSLENVENLQIADYSTLYINLNSSETSKMAQVVEILNGFQGVQKARICFADTREVKLPKGVSGVNITKDLLMLLEKLCGKQNIKLK